MFFSDLNIPKSYYLIDDYRKLSWLRSKLLEAKEFAFDIETNHPTTKSKDLRRTFRKSNKHRICGISFAWGRTKVQFPWRPGTAAYIPLSKSDDEDFWHNQAEVMEVIAEILTCDVPKIAQNGKFDTKNLLRLEGIKVTNFNFDTMLAHGLIDEDREVSAHALKSKFAKDGSFLVKGMSDIYLDTSASQFKEDLDDALKHYDPQLKRYSKVPIDILYPYGCADSDLTLSLKMMFEPMLAEENLTWIFNELIMPLQYRLMLSEAHGIPMDLTRAHEESERLKGQVQQLEAAAWQSLGYQMNLASNQQVGKLLFETLKLPGGQRNKHGWVVDDAALSKLDHPLIGPLRTYRSAEKLLSTYVVGPLDLVEDVSECGTIGWVHTDYAVNSLTGRLKSNDPNLSNLSRPENGGLVAKGIYCCPEDYRFVFLDYSQAELRLAAHLSQEPVWIDAFRKGHDAHSATAVTAFGLDCTPDEVKKLYPEKRSAAKTVNFGILFGQSEYALGQALGLTPEEASHFINEIYFGATPTLRAWIDSQHNFAKMYGYVYSIFGRRRHLPKAQLIAPKGRQWPDRSVRPACYRNGIYFAAINLDPKDIDTISEPDLRQKIFDAPNHSLRKCMNCKYVRSCLVNREVKYVQSQVSAAMRVAVNMPIQGSSVDMVSLAYRLIAEEFETQGMKAIPVMHIHDEICVYAPASEVEKALKIMEYYMSDYVPQCVNMSVPMPVDGEVCTRWASKHVLNKSLESFVQKKLENPDKFSGLDQIMLEHLERYPADAYENLLLPA